MINSDLSNRNGAMEKLVPRGGIIQTALGLFVPCGLRAARSKQIAAQSVEPHRWLSSASNHQMQKAPLKRGFWIWCPEAESNHRHEDFQSYEVRIRQYSGTSKHFKINRIARVLYCSSLLNVLLNWWVVSHGCPGTT